MQNCKHLTLLWFITTVDLLTEKYGTHFSLVLRLRPVMFVEANSQGRKKFAAENATTDVKRCTMCQGDSKVEAKESLKSTKC